MATILNTLYPPLVDTFQPSFPSAEGATVTFTISPYNSYLDIKYLHVTLVDQKTNQNALDYQIDQTDVKLRGTTIINGVWIIPFAEEIVIVTENDQQRFANPVLKFDHTNNLYTLTIPKNILKTTSLSVNDKSFNLNNYYKVQLRFDKYTSIIADFNILKQTSDYLIDKRVYFSEWSSVTLIKACPTIIIHFNNFTYEELTDNNEPIYYETRNSVVDYEDREIMKPIPEYLPGTIPFTGNLVFLDGTSISKSNVLTTKGSEYLASYFIEVYNKNDLDTPIKSSGVLYPSDTVGVNTFYWLCDMTSVTDKDFYVKLNFTTNNEYSFSKWFEFKLKSPSDIDFNPTFSYNEINLNAYGQKDTFINTEEDGWLEISITSSFGIDAGSNNEGDIQEDNTLNPGGYLFTKRASSLDNFTEWELIDCVYVHKISDDNVSTDPNLIIEDTYFTRKIIDYTVGSLVSYRYSCQFLRIREGVSVWSKVVKDDEIIYPNFHDILISRKNRQLAIRYNGQITSMSSVTNRIKIDTLGGKYPKFAENAKLRYKQFQINGLITAEEDYNRKFLNDLNFRSEMAAYDNNMDGKYSVRNDTYKEVESMYGTYATDIIESDTDIKLQKKRTQTNTYHDIYPTDNWWWERKFREEVVNWLNDGNPKLYRSMTEGNLIVMFNDISLTPNIQLGRRIWNFSATVYEVGDGYSLDQLSKFGIISINNDYNIFATSDNDSNNQMSIIDNSITRIVNGQLSHVMAGDLIETEKTNKRTPIVQNLTPLNDCNPYRVIINSHNEETYGRYDTIFEQISRIYTGLYKNYSFVEGTSPLNLTNVKIQFESKPQWYNLNSFSVNSDVFGLRMEVKTENAGREISESILLERLPVKDERGNIIAWKWNVKSAYDLSAASTNSWGTYDNFSQWISEWEEKNPNVKGNNLIKIDTEYGTITNITEATIAETYEEALEAAEEQKNYGLGYKLGLWITSPNDSKKEIFRTIFVNEKGYYQVPSNIIVKNIILYDGAIASIDYTAKYKIKYGTENKSVSYETVTDIIGQVSGEWAFNTNITDLISDKYYAYSEEVGEPTSNSYSPATAQYIENLHCINYEGTPYSIIKLRLTGEHEASSYVVGRTGVLNLQTDFPLTYCGVSGKRMVKTTIDRQDFLDEWEYVSDVSMDYSNLNEINPYGWLVYDINAPIGTFKIYRVNINSNSSTTITNAIRRWYLTGNKNSFDSIEEINLKPNTLYGIVDNSEGLISYKLYYLDKGLYNVSFSNDAHSIITAQVPVYGMFNYRTTLVKKIWQTVEPTTA